MREHRPLAQSSSYRVTLSVVGTQSPVPTGVRFLLEVSNRLLNIRFKTLIASFSHEFQCSL